MAAVSNFPHGFTNGVTIRGLPVSQLHPGKVYFVNNSTSGLPEGAIAGSNVNPGTYLKPFSTLDYAVGRCTSGRGDMIVVMPGHAETVSSATALALDVAGVAIVGLGVGSSRPTFTLDTATTATVGVSANNVTIKNVIFSANFADIVSLFTLTTAKHFTLEDVLVKATAANMNFLHVIDTNTTDNAADGLYVDRLTWIEPDGATLAFALVDGTNDSWQLKNSYMNLGGTTTVASAFTIATGKSLTNVLVDLNVIIKAGQTDGSAGVWASTDTATNSGIFRRNYSQNTDDAGNIMVTAASGFSFGPDNYHAGHESEHGVAVTTAFNNA